MNMDTWQQPGARRAGIGQRPTSTPFMEYGFNHKEAST